MSFGSSASENEDCAASRRSRSDVEFDVGRFGQGRNRNGSCWPSRRRHRWRTRNAARYRRSSSASRAAHTSNRCKTTARRCRTAPQDGRSCLCCRRLTARPRAPPQRSRGRSPGPFRRAASRRISRSQGSAPPLSSRLCITDAAGNEFSAYSPQPRLPFEIFGRADARILRKRTKSTSVLPASVHPHRRQTPRAVHTFSIGQVCNLREFMTPTSRRAGGNALEDPAAVG